MSERCNTCGSKECCGASMQAEVSRLNTELKAAREVVCYQPCEAHMGLPLTLTVGPIATPVRKICPHCEPTCACAHIPPTMPIFRSDHLPGCPAAPADEEGGR